MNLKKQIFSGAFWATGGQLIIMIISLLTNIYISNILLPYEFGQFGIIMFFIMVSSVITEGGLSGALIRKKEVNRDDYSTLFVCNIVLSLFCFIILALSSSFIAKVYEDEKLFYPLLASSFIVLLNAFQFVQTTKLTKELKFKQLFYIRLIATILSSSIGIILVIKDYKIWSLIIMNISYYGIVLILLFINQGIYFSLKFNRISFNEFYKFGLNTSLSTLLVVIFDNINQLIIGRFFSIQQSGYYFQGKKIQDVPSNLLNIFFQSVLFPILSKFVDDKQKLYSHFYNLSIPIILFVYIICFLLMTYSEDIFLLLFNEKWLQSALYFKILIFGSLFFIIEQLLRVLYKINNLTAFILKIEIYKKVLQVLFIILTLLFYKKIEFLLLGYFIVNFISCIIYLTLLLKNKIIDLKLIYQYVLDFIIIGIFQFIFYYTYQYIEYDISKILFILLNISFFILYIIYIRNIPKLLKNIY